jgi:hypothetical protein
MGEVFELSSGIPGSLSLLSGIVSLAAFSLYVLTQVNTGNNNDDDDSSPGGGLMQPVA